MGYHHCPIEPDPSDNPEESKDCPDCDGSGEIQDIVNDLLILSKCKRCDGEGTVYEDYRDSYE